MRRFGVLATMAVFTATLIGCDPVFAVQYRQALQPAPARQCVADALAASRVVTVAAPVMTKESGLARAPGFRVIERDSTARNGVTRELIVTHALLDSATSARVAVTYEFMGGGPSADERRRLAVLANEILAEVRSACAPGTVPAAVECRHLVSLMSRNGSACPAV